MHELVVQASHQAAVDIRRYAERPQTSQNCLKSAAIQLQCSIEDLLAPLDGLRAGKVQQGRGSACNVLVLLQLRVKDA